MIKIPSIFMWNVCMFNRAVSKRYNISLEKIVSSVFGDCDEKILITSNILDYGDNKKVKCDHLNNNLFHMLKVLKIYDKWKKINSECESIYSRKINLPECISERIFCFHTNSVIIKRVYSSKKYSNSFDCYNEETKTKIQLKACSVKYDLSSFGPRSKFDKLYFMFIDTNKDKYYIWEIDNIYLDNVQVNQTTSFRQQQEKGLRPRFSIRKHIVDKYNLDPTYVGNI